MSLGPSLGAQQSTGTTSIGDLLTATKNAVIAINTLNKNLIGLTTELGVINTTLQNNSAALVAVLNEINTSIQGISP